MVLSSGLPCTGNREILRFVPSCRDPFHRPEWYQYWTPMNISTNSSPPSGKDEACTVREYIPAGDHTFSSDPWSFYSFDLCFCSWTFFPFFWILHSRVQSISYDSNKHQSFSDTLETHNHN